MAESLFGTATPAVVNATDSVAYSMGTQFVPAVDGTITHGRWRFPTTALVGVTIGVFQVAGTVTLGTKAFSSPVAGAWNEVAFDTPIPVTAGTAYRVAIWTPSHYTATTSYPWPVNSGNLTAPNTNGWFITGPSLVMPTTQSGNSASYFADVVFEPAGAGASAAPAGIAVAVAPGTPATALNRSAAPAGLAVPSALGVPSVSGAVVVPAGLAAAAALGQPTAALNRSATPAGLAVAVQLGAPSPVEPPQTAGSGARIVTTTRQAALVTRTPGRITR
ncbi:DUF4082 domain-containing protein [Paractinoplanes atraurantiacus]|uniref:DUF4082 domain-containing protein n=1 Tax=Paractinoplanes atraurantiacus TaxID=1036182 RepID=A0A285GZV1_9ACTN|nr:DUF4082 domain-containing protein [Actinoplanes atraurantiacus]SNY29027.1 protein of unknown function [Actinoplanes atraurantiacus]